MKSCIVCHVVLPFSHTFKIDEQCCIVTQEAQTAVIGTDDRFCHILKSFDNFLSIF